MVNITLLFSIILSFTLSFIAPPDEGMPETEAEDFWNYITMENPYTDWKQWPGMEGMYEGQSPHGAYLKLYLNDVAYNAVKNDKELPYGSILVKENYGKDKEKLMAVTPMYKSEGFNPDAGDWFWAKYGTDGKAMASGKVQSCIDCHMKVKDKGWIFTECKKEMK